MVVEQAYKTCLRLARQHYENFPVASRLLPKDSRHHIAAIYAFARVADDLADEGDRPAADRLADLERWQWRLNEAVAGRVDRDDSEAADIFTALAATIEACRLDKQPFDDLLSAFAQDVLVTRYETWADLLDYCRRSANPIGRLVLHVSGYRENRLEVLSDRVCTALQLTNFWQDLALDWRKGRVYVPADIRQASGAEEADLEAGDCTAGWRAALGEVAGRTRVLFDQGRPVADGVRGRLRWELRATWLGGVRILDRLAAVDYDAIHRRPSLGWMDAPAIAWKTLRWS